MFSSRSHRNRIPFCCFANPDNLQRLDPDLDLTPWLLIKKAKKIHSKKHQIIVFYKNFYIYLHLHERHVNLKLGVQIRIGIFWGIQIPGRATWIQIHNILNCDFFLVFKNKTTCRNTNFNLFFKMKLDSISSISLFFNREKTTFQILDFL